jgi:hypothetical protein
VLWLFFFQPALITIIPLLSLKRRTILFPVEATHITTIQPFLLDFPIAHHQGFSVGIKYCPHDSQQMFIWTIADEVQAKEALSNKLQLC